MRAFVFDEVGGPITCREVPELVCPADGVLVDVRATGVCRSDWHAWRGHDPVALPHTPGHEFAGVVAAVGERVVGHQVGARVTAPFVQGCGACAYCESGNAQVCPHQAQPGFTFAGSFAQQVVVHQADLNLVPLPDEIDFVTAASLGCRFATAFHALTRQGELQPGEWLAVYGCGGVGLSAIMIAKALGARVVAVDRAEPALARAAEVGADVVLRSGTAEQVKDVTEGGAHVSLDAVGSPATSSSAIHSLRRRGRHVQVGLMLLDNATAPLPWDIVIAWELTVAGSHGMAAAAYPEMLALITSGKLDPKRLVGEVISFDALGSALMAMDQPVLGSGGLTVAAIGEPAPAVHPQ
ncbi:MAG: zinc-dependent alcohol dehydrogenase family protein [Propionibacteriaceae bacterium]|jgi:alcohol dehydrogenase|nr:zinc-dependent alcohol dehydrogenase family protein [Propionibacteriaceae bacterium]